MSKSVVDRPSYTATCYKCGRWPATIVVAHKKRVCEDCNKEE